MEDLIKREDAIEAIEFGITYAKMIDSDGWTKPLFENENRELKKAIERIKDIPSSEPTVDKDYLISLIQEAVYDGEDCARLMKMIEPKQEWIPCSERLPEANEVVLVCYKTTDTIHLCKYLGDGSENPWWSYIDDCCAWNNTVLAWMPLPPAYEGE